MVTLLYRLTDYLLNERKDPPIGIGVAVGRRVLLDRQNLTDDLFIPLHQSESAPKFLETDPPGGTPE